MYWDLAAEDNFISIWDKEINSQDEKKTHIIIKITSNLFKHDIIIYIYIQLYNIYLNFNE